MGHYLQYLHKLRHWGHLSAVRSWITIPTRLMAEALWSFTFSFCFQFATIYDCSQLKIVVRNHSNLRFESLIPLLKFFNVNSILLAFGVFQKKSNLKFRLLPTSWPAHLLGSVWWSWELLLSATPASPLKKVVKQSNSMLNIVITTWFPHGAFQVSVEFPSRLADEWMPPHLEVNSEYLLQLIWCSLILCGHSDSEWCGFGTVFWIYRLSFQMLCSSGRSSRSLCNSSSCYRPRIEYERRRCFQSCLPVHTGGGMGRSTVPGYQQSGGGGQQYRGCGSTVWRVNRSWSRGRRSGPRWTDPSHPHPTWKVEKRWKVVLFRSW